MPATNGTSPRHPRSPLCLVRVAIAALWEPLGTRRRRAADGSQARSGVRNRLNTEIRFRNSPAARPVDSNLVSQRSDRNAEHSRGVRPVSPTPNQRFTNQFAFDRGNGMAHKPANGFHFICRKFQVSDNRPQRHDPSISRQGNFADAMSNSAVAMPHKHWIRTKKKLSRISGKTRRLSGISFLMELVASAVSPGNNFELWTAPVNRGRVFAKAEFQEFPDTLASFCCAV